MRAVFLSYRRDDTQTVTGFIYQHLSGPTGFGPDSVFMDIDTIPYGVDFREVIDDTVTRCRFFLAVIGPRWVSQRLHQPDDFVRLEIEAALERGIPVVPVLVDGATMPKPDELPECLRPLVYMNAISLRAGKWFNADLDQLVKALPKAEEWKRTKNESRGVQQPGVNVQVEQVATPTLPGSTKLEHVLDREHNTTTGGVNWKSTGIWICVSAVVIGLFATLFVVILKPPFHRSQDTFEFNFVGRLPPDHPLSAPVVTYEVVAKHVPNVKAGGFYVVMECGQQIAMQQLDVEPRKDWSFKQTSSPPALQGSSGPLKLWVEQRPNPGTNGQVMSNVVVIP